MENRFFDFVTLSNKKSDSVTGKVDFLSTYTVIENKDLLPIIDHIYITDDIVCRLDLICQHYYGCTDELDLLMKFNEIDDPFSLPVGKHILIPDRFALMGAAKTVSTDTDYSLDANESPNIDIVETATQTRTKLQNRTSFITVKNGVLQF